MTTKQRPMLGEPPAGFDEDQLKYPDPPRVLIASIDVSARFGIELKDNEDRFHAFPYTTKDVSQYVCDAFGYEGRELPEKLAFEIIRANGFDYIIEGEVVVVLVSAEWQEANR
jgi:hypothetical protein